LLASLIGSKMKAKDKMFKELLSNPRIVIGNIHSHNSMPANFSSVDIKTLEEMAPDSNFYVSTVWSTNTKSFDGAISYKDQYGVARTLDLPLEKSMNQLKPNPVWDAEIEFIQELKKADEQAKLAQKRSKAQTSIFPSYTNGWGKGWDKVGNKLSMEDPSPAPFDMPLSEDDYMEYLVNAFDKKQLTEADFYDELADYGYEKGDAVILRSGRRIL
jgi:hypothetical protein